jgi:DNA-binding transcriptional ArsR family regulator
MVLQSLDRGLDALNILAKHDLVSVTELAKELGVDKSTASRIMETLRQHDMVQLDKKTRKYKLGFRVLHLAERFRSRLQIIDIARPVLLEVSRELGQSVHLCAYNKGMVYVIDQVVSDLPYSMSAMVGLSRSIPHLWENAFSPTAHRSGWRRFWRIMSLPATQSIRSQRRRSFWRNLRRSGARGMQWMTRRCLSVSVVLPFPYSAT